MEDENAQLRETIRQLEVEVAQKKTLAEAFEKRFIEIQIESAKKDEEIARLKAARGGRSTSTTTVAKRSEVDTDEDEEVSRKLFIGGLHPTTSNESLTEYFRQFGEVVHAIVMKDAANGNRSKGFGFIIYSSTSMIDAAQAARPHTVDGKVVDTKRAVRRGDPTGAPATGQYSAVRGKRIFVGGLKSTTEDSTMREYFTSFGTIVSVDRGVDKGTGNKKGYAYVVFTDHDAVDKACQHQFHNIDDRKVEVKRAVDKADMIGRRQFPGQNPGPYGGGLSGPVPGPMPDMYAQAYQTMMGAFVRGAGGMPPAMGGFSYPGGDYGGATGGSAMMNEGWSGGASSGNMAGGPAQGAGGYGMGGYGAVVQTGNMRGGGGSGGFGGKGGNAQQGNKTVGSAGPMRSNSRWTDRATGPYPGVNYGPYGSVQTPNV